jgi:hypothetical protein
METTTQQERTHNLTTMRFPECVLIKGSRNNANCFQLKNVKTKISETVVRNCYQMLKKLDGKSER